MAARVWGKTCLQLTKAGYRWTIFRKFNRRKDCTTLFNTLKRSTIFFFFVQIAHLNKPNAGWLLSKLECNFIISILHYSFLEVHVKLIFLKRIGKESIHFPIRQWVESSGDCSLLLFPLHSMEAAINGL